MFKPTILKTGEIDTPIGRASVLRFNRQRLLSFPSCIDTNCKIAMQAYYSTLQWPRKADINDIAEFIPGPSLPGPGFGPACAGLARRRHP